MCVDMSFKDSNASVFPFKLSIPIVVILLLRFFYCEKTSELMLAKGSAAEQSSANWFLTEFLVLLLV